MPTDIEVLPPLELMSSRAEEVRTEITQLKDSIMASSLKLGRLLKEARDNQYHHIWGYAQFGLWVEEASGLDMSERQCYYLIAVVERAEACGIPDEELNKVKLSKLKTIFSLPADTDPETIKTLVREAETAPLDDVREVVGRIKNVDFVFKTLKMERDTYENVYSPAMDKARLEYGNSIDFKGDPKEIEDDKAIEMICATYLSGPDIEESETVDAEFEDVVAQEAA